MTMSLKESCAINLGFPYHQSKPAEESLSSLCSFMSEQKLLARENDIEFGNDHGAHLLEAKVATLLDLQAALWLPTGTLAEGIAARIHGQKARNVANLKSAKSGQILLHPTSHLLLHEEQGYQYAHGCSAKVIGTWREPLTLYDIADNTGCVFVELAQRHSGGKLPSWDELQRIKKHCNMLDMSLHMDGARLWSCRDFYGGRSYAEIVSGFDSVYVSLYKDIGAMGGAILAGNGAFIDEARIWRTRLGGFSVGSWPLIYDALQVIDKRLEQIPEFVEKAKVLAGKLIDVTTFRIDPIFPHTNMFHILLNIAASEAENARDQIAREQGIWLSDRFWSYESPDTCAMEIVVGEKALAMNEQQFCDAMLQFEKVLNVEK